MGNARERALAKIRAAKEKRLTELDFNNHENKEKLAEIPPEVFGLEWLEGLDLSSNQLTEIPEPITRLSKTGNKASPPVGWAMPTLQILSYFLDLTITEK